MNACMRRPLTAAPHKREAAAKLPPLYVGRHGTACVHDRISRVEIGRKSVQQLEELIQEGDRMCGSGGGSRSIQLGCKRVLDLLGSAVLLVVLSSLFLLIALLTKLTSMGPVFYRQPAWA